LILEPEGSRYIVFRKDKQKPHVTEIRKDNQSVFTGFSFETKEHSYIDFTRNEDKVIAEINEPGSYSLVWSDGRKEELKSDKPNESVLLTGEWDIQFDPNWGAPKSVKTDQLKSWTEFDVPGIKYYSGTATYRKSFQLNNEQIKGTRLILDLGFVKEMASVKINGHQMQVLWSAPFRFDITPFAKTGANELGVEVVNMWVNRMVGDGKLPVEQRLTTTNINKFNSPDAEQYLRVSGLMGPVKLIQVKEVNLE
jgi:hypothetical protein